MTANEIRGELVTMLAYIHDAEKLEKLKDYMQSLLSTKKPSNDGLTDAQAQVLQAVYEQSTNHETAFVSQEEAHKLFAQWRG